MTFLVKPTVLKELVNRFLFFQLNGLLQSKGEHLRRHQLLMTLVVNFDVFLLIGLLLHRILIIIVQLVKSEHQVLSLSLELLDHLLHFVALLRIVIDLAFVLTILMLLLL